jgi:uncharacterized pyridoxal phosphate-containing UPF0001 family protein
LCYDKCYSHIHNKQAIATNQAKEKEMTVETTQYGLDKRTEARVEEIKAKMAELEPKSIEWTLLLAEGRMIIKNAKLVPIN